MLLVAQDDNLRVNSNIALSFSFEYVVIVSLILMKRFKLRLWGEKKMLSVYFGHYSVFFLHLSTRGIA